MNIKIFLAVVGALALGSGVLFWQLGRTPGPHNTGSAPAIPADTITSTPSSNDPISGRGSLSALLALARNLECAVANDADPQSTSEGTVFISEGNIRGDFLTGPRGEQVLSSLIVRDNTMYLWSTIDGETWGMKSSLTTATVDPAAPQLETQEPIGLEDDIRYDCKPWTAVDGSVFVPPGEVLFRDQATVMEQGMEYGTTFDASAPAVQAKSVPGGGNPCAACALVTEPAAKEACEIRFSCGLQAN